MTQQAQLEMIVEEISHRPQDTEIVMRTNNGNKRRDSVLWLSTLGRQVTELKIGQRLRVTVDVIE
jgi:hypothetical protein